jgi:hypothetical protein
MFDGRSKLKVPLGLASFNIEKVSLLKLCLDGFENLR